MEIQIKLLGSINKADTLNRLIKKLGIDENAKFDKDMQDKLGTELLKERGLDDYKSGKITKKEFALGLAQEWAAFPLLEDKGKKKKGESYYKGTGNNKAGMSVEDFHKFLDSVKNN